MKLREIEVSEISRHMKEAKTASELRWWQIINTLKKPKIDVKKAAEINHVSQVTVYAVIKKFNSDGPEGLMKKKVGGRVWAFLSLEEEKHLIDSLFDESTKGIIITAKTIQNKAEEVLQKPVSIDYAYDLLHRHGWRKVSPRPQHPKSNVEAQEEFKKKFRKQYKIVSQPSI